MQTDYENQLNKKIKLEYNEVTNEIDKYVENSTSILEYKEEEI
jgi:hypothetical protein